MSFTPNLSKVRAASTASRTKASRDREEILIVPCDPKLQEETRRHWPFLRDRRIDAYEMITNRYIDAK
ncbi:MAG: hypothetical protein J0H19_00710 [Rhodospirillales bacterium]|nr:hypothetical protein [Rhodospirillales bacterium]